jgi:hypothetical protein
MTYDGPGMTTRSEVKISVKEGKGKLAMPISEFGWRKSERMWRWKQTEDSGKKSFGGGEKAKTHGESHILDLECQ